MKIRHSPGKRSRKRSRQKDWARKEARRQFRQEAKEKGLSTAEWRFLKLLYRNSNRILETAFTDSLFPSLMIRRDPC